MIEKGIERTKEVYSEVTADAPELVNAYLEFGLNNAEDILVEGQAAGMGMFSKFFGDPAVLVQRKLDKCWFEINESTVGFLERYSLLLSGESRCNFLSSALILGCRLSSLIDMIIEEFPPYQAALSPALLDRTGNPRF